MLKNWKLIAGALIGILVLVLGGMVWYSGRQHDRYLEYKARAELRESEYTALEKKSDAEKAALAAANERLEKERLAAIAKAEEAEREKGKAIAEAEAEKAKTAALPAPDLVLAINKRIGEMESWYEARGTFSFSRPGTEKTLNIFIDGETAAENYRLELVTSAKWKGAHETAIAERDNEKAAKKLEEGKVVALKLTKGEIEKAMKALERSIPGMKWRSRLEGGAVGFLTSLGLRLLKVL